MPSRCMASSTASGSKLGTMKTRAAQPGDAVASGTIGKVEHRTAVQIHLAFVFVNGAHKMIGITDEVAVTEHDTFRVAGRATGIEESSEVVFFHLHGCKVSRRLGQTAPHSPAYRLGCFEQPWQSPWVASTDVTLSTYRVLPNLRLLAAEYCQSPLRDIGQFGWRQTEIERHDERSQSRRGIVHLQVGKAVGTQYRDATAFGDTMVLSTLARRYTRSCSW